MNKEIIEQRVIEAIRNILEDQEISIQPEDSLLDDVELSSLEVLELFAVLEEQFGCVIEEKKMRGFVTIQNIIDYIYDLKDSIQL